MRSRVRITLALILTFLSTVAIGTAVAQDRGGAAQSPAAPTDVQPGSINLEDIAYPHPVACLPMTVYGHDVRMAYMDVPPAGQPNGHTVVLFHGMNFAGFYFEGPIDALRTEGFRVVVTDQIGFGRSSKPIIPYNLDPVVYDRSHIEAPTLCFGGAEDGEGFPERMQFVCDSVPDGNGRVYLLPGLGHVPHFEAPERTYPPLIAFLKEGIAPKPSH